ncbi:methyltransferase domain-containing protein [Nitrobacter sp. TKz-YC02]|uniref:class I SAM-dependent methyltransferase n=1 Tax=Nitrobacter sp. TKz-YC02 TaxID=3398704 RepID=UPI003CFA206F
MLARDWFYSERGRIGLDSLIAARSAIYDHDDSGSRARATLAKLGVRPGWRIADIGCGTGTLACEAARMGAEVYAVDIAPAALALAEAQARDGNIAIRTQAAGLLSFALASDSLDLVVSEFTLHHLPDFWKAVALSRMFRVVKPGGQLFLRDIVFVREPDGSDRTVEQWAEFNINNHDFPSGEVASHMRDEHSTFGWVIERMLKDVGFTLVSADYHAPLHGTYLCRKPGDEPPA